MPTKEFKSIEEQINILKTRGLTISDEKLAADFLYKNNYYRVSGYSLTLRHHDVFSKTATFQNIIDIYECDHDLRHILLKYIEIVEIKVKSIYAYEFSKAYGPVGYLDSSNFTDLKIYDNIIQKADALKKLRLPHEAYLKHFVNELHEDIPLWAYADLLTISDISFLYKISDVTLKTSVANVLGLNKNGAELLERFMKHLTIIRNLCAHGSRLYNRLFEQRPSLNRQDKALLRRNKDGSLDNSHLYGYIFIMRRLLNKEDFSNMYYELVALSDKYNFVNMKYYGFREDWKDVLV